MANEFCDAHSGMLADIQTLKDDRDEQWKVINELRNRLPAWATIVISLLTFLLGCSLTYAALAVKIVQPPA